MGPPRRGAPKKAAPNDRSNNKKKADNKEKKRKPEPRPRGGAAARAGSGQHDEDQNQHQHQAVDRLLSATIPLTLQQLLLNVIKSALLLPSRRGGGFSSSRGEDPDAEAPTSEQQKEEEEKELDIKPLIQTIKSHLYNRDFAAAFAGASEEHLRAYALRWSATRALGYAGVLKGVVRGLLLRKNLGTSTDEEEGADGAVHIQREGDGSATNHVHVVCLGGGAGAEIVALAGVWRDMRDEGEVEARARAQEEEISAGVEGISLDGQSGTDVPVNRNGTSSSSGPDNGPALPEQEPEKNIDPATQKKNGENTKEDGKTVPSTVRLPNLSVTAVDIADWSAVVDRLSRAIKSPAVPGTKGHSAPLLPTGPEKEVQGGRFDVHFQRADVLALTDEELKRLLLPPYSDVTSENGTTGHGGGKTVLVTLMFTLNELFSTSMAKTTAFLLRMTDLLEPGTILLVVDSPGSYSTVSFGKKMSSSSGNADSNKAEQQQQQRTYPMRFLLDHTLMSVAADKWERVFSQDSRWFRREAAKLRYDVGEGAGLEDMRFQIHIYRRLDDG